MQLNSFPHPPKSLIKANSLIIKEKKVIILFDQGNEPNYGPGEGNYGPSSGGLNYEMPANMGKYIKAGILLVIIIIALVGGVMWWTSQKAVMLNLTDSAGNELNGTLTLKDNTGKPISVLPKGSSSSFNVTLWPGEYTATARADNFKQTTKVFTVGGSESASVQVVLLRDLTATLEVLTVPSRIYDSQTITGQIQINNSGPAIKITDIGLSKNDALQVTINNPDNSIEIGANSSKVLDFNLSVKSKYTTSKDTNFYFVINGSSIKSKSTMVTILPSILATKLTVSGVTASTSLGAGEQTPITITLRNTEKLPMENIRLRIITTDSASTEALAWMKFNQATESDKTTFVIAKLDPNEQKQVKLLIDTPLTARKDDEFNGQLEITSYSLKSDIKLDLLMKVTREKTASVEFGGTNNFTLNCSSTTKSCQPKVIATEIKLVNKGNVEVKNIEVSIDPLNSTSPALCAGPVGTGWIMMNTKTIASLAATGSPEAEQPVLMNIIPTYDTRPVDAAIGTLGCSLKWRYTNPLTQQVQTADKMITFNITTSK